MLCIDSCDTKVFVKTDYGSMCVDKCDDNMYTLARYGYTECVKSCPTGKFFSENSCVDSCEIYMDNPTNDPLLARCANNCGIDEGVIF